MLKSQVSLENAKKAQESCDQAYGKFRLARSVYSTEHAKLTGIQNACGYNGGHNWSKLEENGSPEEDAVCKDCGLIFGP